MITKRVPRNSSVERLLDRQFKSRELGSAQQRAASPARQTIGEFLTISQQPGAGGTDVAAALGERLGWPVFDKQILHAMARDDESRERLYRSLDERNLGWFVEACRSLMDTAFRRNDYFHRLTQTVQCIARQGPVILIGRGADLILPPDCGLRVRFVAPEKARVERFARENQLTEREAREEMTRIERERAGWISSHWHVAAEDNTRYDLVLNLSRMSVREATELILAALSLRRPEYPADEPRGGTV